MTPRRTIMSDAIRAWKNHFKDDNCVKKNQQVSLITHKVQYSTPALLKGTWVSQGGADSRWGERVTHWLLLQSACWLEALTFWPQLHLSRLWIYFLILCTFHHSPASALLHIYPCDIQHGCDDCPLPHFQVIMGSTLDASPSIISTA